MHTILIVEDDSTIHMMMHEYLEKRGFRCEDAYSGTEALLHIRQACPDLILMDLMLPGADGSEVLHEIRKAHDVPVIVVSAKGSVQHKVDLLKAGADDYMTKPFSLEELEARIRAQLRRRGHRPVDTTLRCGTLSLLDDQRTLMIEDRRITLTRHESCKAPGVRFPNARSMNMPGKTSLRPTTRPSRSTSAISAENAAGKT